MVIGESFTDHSNVCVPSSNYICIPCIWVLSGKPPNTFRLWSVVYRQDRKMSLSDPKVFRKVNGIHFTKRTEPREIVDILINPPRSGLYFVVVALTGKKHTLPFAKINFDHRLWTVRFEDKNIQGTSSNFRNALFNCALLHSLGFTCTEIETGNVCPNKVAENIEEWRRCQRELRVFRETDLLKSLQ